MKSTYHFSVSGVSALAALSMSGFASAHETYTQQPQAERRVPAESAPAPGSAAGATNTARSGNDRVADTTGARPAVRSGTQATQRSADARRMQPRRITEAVENELSHDSLVSLDNVSVAVTGQTATLNGKVNSLIAKERAADLARTVRGVGEVVNNLTVQPRVKRNSDEIESMVRQALLLNPATESFQVDIVALPDGAVTLSGTVDSGAERTLSEHVAKSVAGVTKMTNDIKVSPSVQRSDRELSAEIERILQWDAFVDSSEIDVVVQDGVVKLSGAVDSAAEKNRAVTTAFTSGTKRVDARSLKVTNDAASDRGQLQPTLKVTDPEITQAVQMRLRQVPWLSKAKLDVEVIDGVATLRGTVNTIEARRTARATARQTLGVDRVRDRLRVEAGTTPNDSELESKIVAALAASPFTEAYEITVDVNNGVAHLSGDVDSWFERAAADDVVASIRGVRKIDNRLDVELHSDRLVFDPYIDAWSIYDFDWYQPTPVTVWTRDSTIAEEINDELFWSPFVDANEVKVTVNAGVATLSGTVDSIAELTAAQENAFEGGASAVVNKLKIES